MAAVQKSDSGITFRIARNEDKKRDQEVKDGQRKQQRPPRPLKALLVPEHFLRHVRVPHEHVLGEPDVGPEYGEGEEEAAQVVHVVGADPGEPSAALQIKQRQRRGRQAGQECAGKNIDSEYIAVPGRLEARDPVEGHHRDGDPEDNHEEGSEAPGAQVELGIPVLILPERSGHKYPVGKQPEGEAGHHAQGKERDVQPDRLPGDDRILQALGLGPRIQERQ